jgi:hypothetical protein
MINKIILGFLGALLLQTSVASAQETMENKNGQEILPQAGDIGLGVNAVPILNFVGNTFNGNSNNTYISQNRFVSNLGNNVIFGKYMLSGTTAIRAHLRVGISSFSNRNYVYDDTKNSPDSLVTDYVKINNSTYVLGAGYEMRRGFGRLRGFYGGELFLGYGKSNQRTYQYGNVFGSLNAAPTTTAWDFNGNPGTENATAQRPVNVNSGGTFTVGIRPFIGFEYYFAPRIAIGTEFGWGLGYSVTGKGTSSVEFFEATSGNTLQTTIPVQGSGRWSIDTDNFNGALFLMFYF